MLVVHVSAQLLDVVRGELVAFRTTVVAWPHAVHVDQMIFQRFAIQQLLTAKHALSDLSDGDDFRVRLRYQT